MVCMFRLVTPLSSVKGAEQTSAKVKPVHPPSLLLRQASSLLNMHFWELQHFSKHGADINSQFTSRTSGGERKPGGTN